MARYRPIANTWNDPCSGSVRKIGAIITADLFIYALFGVPIQLWV